MPKPSVKIMLSYDYCHFEIALSSDDDMSFEQTNELRKSAQRLADEAVRQFQVAKRKAGLRFQLENERIELEEEVKKIRNLPIAKWTAEQKAKTKALEDGEYWEQHIYDYEDDVL